MAIQKISGVTIGLTSQASGDVAYFDGTDWVRLAKGEAGQVLTMNETVTAPEWGTSWTFPGTVKGYCAAGNLSPSGAAPYATDIQRWSFTSDVSATDVGDVTGVGRSHMSGQSSETHGYISGSGHITQPINITIDRWSFASEGNATDHGDLAVASGQGTGQSSETHGYHSGGNNGAQGSWTHTYLNNIQKFAFASTGSTNNATDIADLTVVRTCYAGASSSTHGYSAGGGGPNTGGFDTIDKFSYATDINATDVGDCDTTTDSSSGTSSLTHGYITGGSGPATDSIRRYSFASDGNSTIMNGELTAARHAHTGCSSETYGYSAAGHGGGGGINIIEKYSVSTDSNATDVGDVTIAKWYSSPVGSQV
jgi:hypothetical protein